MNAKAPRAGCLSHADIVALLNGSLPSVAQASAHLGACRDCQAAVDEASRVPEVDRRLADWSQGERHRFAPRPGFVPVDLGTPVPPDLTGTPDPACQESAPPAGLETVGPVGLPAGQTAGPVTRTLGKYRLLRLLGEGGMGRVWEAEDTELHRRVALKEVRPEFGDSPAIHERFLREARMLAGISHDHVVVIYDAGRAEDELFIVMELLDGEPLDRLFTRVGPLPIMEAVRIAREAALGLAQLHARGLVHRDVKPGNLFLQGPGGRVKLLDLGLARPAESEPGFTRSGAVVGTPNYMSPEQAAGKPVDARTDLFSLGCVLYHALTGKTPFKGETPMMVMSSVLRDDPAPVSGLRPDTPPALADLVRRLLSKAPKGRPASAAEVAEELSRIKPRRPRSWVTTALAAAALLLGLALSALVVIKITHKDGKQTTFKVPPGTEVEVGKDGEIKVKLPDGGKEPPKDGKDGKEPVKGGGPPAARPSGVLGDPADRSRGKVNSLAFSADGSRLLAGTHDGRVRWWDVAARKEAWSAPALDLAHERYAMAALSPDGKRVVSAGAHMRLKMWDVGAEAPAAVMGLEPAREYVLCPPAFLPDGKHALAAHRDHHEGPTTVRLWDLEGKSEVRAFKVPKYVRTVSVEPGGKRFVTAGDDGVARIWDVGSGKLLARLPDGEPGKPGLAVWSPAGPFLLVGESSVSRPAGAEPVMNGAVKVWELADGGPKPRASFPLPGTYPTRAAWSRDGRRLAFSTADGRLIVRAFPSGDPLGEWGVPDVGALAFSPGGCLAVGTGASIALLELYPEVPASERREWQPKELAAVLGTHARERDKLTVTGIEFNKDGSRLLSGGRDDYARWWDVAAGKEVAALVNQRGQGGVQAALSPDGRLAVLSGWHQRIKVWDLEGDKEAGVFGRDPAAEVVNCHAAFTPDGRHFFLAHRDRHDGPTTVRRYESATRKGSTEYGHPRYVQYMVVSADGKRLLTSSNDGLLRIWDIEGGKETGRLAVPATHAVNQLALSPDGRFVLSGVYTRDGKAGHSARVWEWRGDGLKPVATYDGIDEGPVAAVWSRDGRRLAYADEAGRLIVRDFPSGARCADWTLPKAVSTLAFAPDGRHLAVGTRWGAIYLLRLPEVAPAVAPPGWPKGQVATLGKEDESGKSAVASLSYTADGGRLLAGGRDGYARLWATATREPLSVIEGKRGETVQASISPDGRLAVLAGHHMQVRVWDVKADKEAKSFGRGPGEEVVFSRPVFLPDGKGFFLAHRDGHGKGTTVRLYDTEKFAEKNVFTHEKYVSDLAVSPDGKRLATAAEDGKIRVWDVASGKKTVESFMPGDVGRLAWAPSGPRLLLGVVGRRGEPATIQVWDADADAGVIRRAQLAGAPTALAWAADGKAFAFADQTGRVSVQGLPGGDLAWEIPKPALSLAFAPDCKTLAVGTSAGTVLLLGLPAPIPEAERREWQPKELLAILGTHTKEIDKAQVGSLAFMKDGSRLLSGGADGYARLWAVPTGKELAAFLNHAGAGVRAAVSPDARLLVLAGQRVRVRDLEADKELGTFGRDDDSALVLVDPLFGPDGKGFFLAHRDGHKMGTTVRLYDAATREERARFPHPKAADDESVPNRYVSGMAVSPDGKRLVTAAEDGGVRLWDVGSGKKLDEVSLPAANGASVVRWSSDGRLLVGRHARTGHPDTKAGKARNAIQVWEVKGDKLRLADDHPDLAGHPVALALSADGKTAAFVDDAGRVGVRTLPTWGKVADWTMPGVVSSLALTPDGRMLALGTRWGAVYLVRVPGR